MAKVLVEAYNGAFIFNFNKPTELGKFLEETPNWLILEGEDLCWVKQVIENLENGYSYQSIETTEKTLETA